MAAVVINCAVHIKGRAEEIDHIVFRKNRDKTGPFLPTIAHLEVLNEMAGVMSQHAEASNEEVNGLIISMKRK